MENNIENQNAEAQAPSGNNEVRYLTPLSIESGKQKKYCRFKRLGIKYIDYKDADFLLKFVNEQGKIHPPPSDRNFSEIPEKSSNCH